MLSSRDCLSLSLLISSLTFIYYDAKPIIIIRYVNTILSYKSHSLHARHSIRHVTILCSRIIAKARVIILRPLGHLLLRLDERAQLAPPVLPARVALRDAVSQRQRALVQHKVDILCLAAGQEPVARRRHGLGRLDDLHVQARAERRHVGDGEVVRARVSVRRQLFGELAQAKRSQDRHDVGVVRKVKVQRLVERERLGAAVERRVDLRAGVAERVVLEACENFLLVAEADGSLKDVSVSHVSDLRGRETYADRAVEGIRRGKGEVDRVPKARPLLVRKQVAELAEAVCHRLVGTHGLRVVDVLGCPLEAIRHLVESVGCCSR